jgi:DNA-binding transcriptional regulator YhcF (GntR family)
MNDIVEPAFKQTVLLIDLENTPNQIEQLQDNLAHFSQVIICYAQNHSKIPLDWLMSLTAAINANKLKLVKMEQSGKNAADFGLCFYAGMLMHSLPENTHFVIISNDTDLDHVVRLLMSEGRSAQRVGKQKQTPLTSTELMEPLTSYCHHLITYCRNRPTKKESLLNSLASYFKKNSATVDAVFTQLVNKGVVTITNNKVTYHDEMIEKHTKINHQ